MGLKKQFHGLCFSVGGETGEASSEAKRKALEFVAPHTKWIRIYGPQYESAYAKKLGIKIAACAWIGRDEKANERSLRDLAAASRDKLVDLAVIGNEVLLRQEMSGRELARYIRQFKEMAPKIPVTTGEVAKFLVENPEVIAACDIVGMHQYPFWDGIHIEDAIENFNDWYRKVVSVSGKKPVWVLETGWPTAGFDKDGNLRGAAVPSVQNAMRYFSEFMRWAERNNVRSFWFEAFDEQWKIRDEGSIGQNWGVWTHPMMRRKY